VAAGLARVPPDFGNDLALIISAGRGPAGSLLVIAEVAH
jgi:hypothetical protein